jgi:TRAP-type C4-dicarboxylate transport system substrate-binding protein
MIRRSETATKPWLCALVVALAAHVANAGPTASPADAKIRLRIVGGLANVHQYTRNEQPFWTSTVPARTLGRVTAEIVPFDQAGIRGHEVLRLMEIGIVPFGTALLGVASSSDPEYGAADLAGLNPDMAMLRRVTSAFRPHLERSLRERYGIELLAVYAYPAQVLFCKGAFSGLGDLKGRRIRTATPSQSDFVEALGAAPVRTPFTDMMNAMKSGNADCAITGSMSGNTIGLHEVTTHVHSLPISWGLSIFGANSQAWHALPTDVRSLLGKELQQLESDIWAEAERETAEGLACSTGAPGCSSGMKGNLTEVKASLADRQRQREAFLSSVLPGWIKRCGPECSTIWNRLLKHAAYDDEAKGK